MHIVALGDRLQRSAFDAHDIPDDILKKHGFNVKAAEQSASFAVQRARVESESHRFDQWREPLEFGDGRLPDENVLTRYDKPEWLSDDEVEEVEEEDEDA
eukprot:s290_g26.t1